MSYAQNYKEATSQTLFQQEVESNALVNMAAKLNALKQDWDGDSEITAQVLEMNRKLWTILVAEAIEPTNPLPQDVKQNVVNVAYFIFKHTLKMLAQGQAQGLDVLININLNVAKGLSEGLAHKRAEEKAKAQMQAQQGLPVIEQTA
ncbi:MAG: flagellar biosynthesis regulator FlaF [Alphaproteobacteria bacterium]|nr:flagellar biosynthesis regulator FlaF [Alphaproteobacteria bacterium]